MSTCFTKYDISRLKCIDIAANLTDGMYNGFYNNSMKQTHANDVQKVIDRAWFNHLDKIIITGTSLKDSINAINLANTSDRLYATVGVHPTSCLEFTQNESSEKHLEQLKDLIMANTHKVVAFGEFGLDYDRLHFCPKEVQLKYFQRQLDLAKHIKKPLFLHCRNSFDDFYQILKRNHDELLECGGGVVHSFTGNLKEAQDFLDLGFYIGINGCSLKTEENIRTMLSIPSERLLIETDCPWCEVKQSHVSFKHVRTRFAEIKKEKWDEDVLVKGRNEPVKLIQILEILSATRDEDIYELANKVYENTMKLFFSNE